MSAARAMKVVGFAGFSGAGKTTLVEQLIAGLKARGLRVSVLKHAHHRFDVDQPGKDSYRHRAAGAYEVLLASSRRLALMRELEATHEWDVHELIAELQPDVDWVLVEGFKASALPKIEVWRPASARYAGAPALYPQDPQIVAVATSNAQALPSACERPVLNLDDAASVLRWLLDNAQRFHYVSEPLS